MSGFSYLPPYLYTTTTNPINTTPLPTLQVYDTSQTHLHSSTSISTYSSSLPTLPPRTDSTGSTHTATPIPYLHPSHPFYRNSIEQQTQAQQPSGLVAAEANKNTPVCEYWLKGHCVRGGSCAYAHTHIAQPSQSTNLSGNNTSTPSTILHDLTLNNTMNTYTTPHTQTPYGNLPATTQGGAAAGQQAHHQQAASHSYMTAPSHTINPATYSTGPGTLTPYSQPSTHPHTQLTPSLYGTPPNSNTYAPSLPSTTSQRTGYNPSSSYPQPTSLQTTFTPTTNHHQSSISSSSPYKLHTHAAATGGPASPRQPHGGGGYPSVVRQPSRAIPSSNQSVPLPPSSAAQLIPQLAEFPGLRLEDLRLVRHECTSPNGTVFPAGSRPFKTKLCNNYELQGVCPRESQCTYAHGSLNITCKFCAFGLYQLGWQNSVTGEFYGYIQLNNGKIQLSTHQHQILKQLNSNDTNTSAMNTSTPADKNNNVNTPGGNGKSVSRASTIDPQLSQSRLSNRTVVPNDQEKENEKHEASNDSGARERHENHAVHDHVHSDDDDDPSCRTPDQQPHDLTRSYHHMSINHRHRRERSGANENTHDDEHGREHEHDHGEEYHDGSESRRNSQSPSYRWWTSHATTTSTTPGTPPVSSYTSYSPPPFSRRTTASSRVEGSSSAPRNRSRTWSQASTVNTVLTQDTFTRTRDSRTNTVTSNATNNTHSGSGELDDVNYTPLSFEKQMIATALTQRYRLSPPISSDSHIDELPSDVDLPDILYVSADTANDALKHHFLSNANLTSSLRTAVSIVVWRQSPVSTATPSSTNETNEQWQEREQQKHQQASGSEKHEPNTSPTSDNDKEKSPSSAPTPTATAPISTPSSSPTSSFTKQVSTDLNQQHLVAIASRHILVVIDLPNALASTIPSALIELLQTGSILKITTNDVLAALQSEQITIQNTLNIHSLIHLLSQTNERLPLNDLFDKYLHVKLQGNQSSDYTTSVNPAYGTAGDEAPANDKGIEFPGSTKASGFDMQHTASAAYLLHSLSMMIRETWRRR